MTRDEAREKYAYLVQDFYCDMAYWMDGYVYYRYMNAYLTVKPGDISFLKVPEDGGDPVPVGAVEFHEAQKAIKIK